VSRRILRPTKYFQKKGFDFYLVASFQGQTILIIRQTKSVKIFSKIKKFKK